MRLRDSHGVDIVAQAQGAHSRALKSFLVRKASCLLARLSSTHISPVELGWKVSSDDACILAALAARDMTRT